MLITKLCSHVWGEAAGSFIPAPPGTAAPVVQSLSEYKESQKATWIPEKFPPAVSKKTC